MAEEKRVEIYQGGKGKVIFNVDAGHETIWATQEQIAELFDVGVNTINYHLKDIFKTSELDENRTIRKNRIVRTEGSRKVRREINFYNLDAIISVGYRVNSKKATNFRIWATQTLKKYVVDGIAINEHRLKQLNSEKLKNVENMMGVVRRLISRQELDAGEANGVLEVISKYAGSFQTLKEYDDGFIDLSSVNAMVNSTNGKDIKTAQGKTQTAFAKNNSTYANNHSASANKKQKQLTPDMCTVMIDELRASVNGGELFGKKRNNSFDGALNSIYQSFSGKELYPSVSEKAANLLYFVIKDHPFYDGNKRIGALLFIMFLTINDYHLTENGETKISDRALTALALLIAESNPTEKSLIVSLTRKLLE